MKFKMKPEILSEEQREDKEKLAQLIISGAENSLKNDLKNEELSPAWKKQSEKLSSIKETNFFSLRIPKDEMLQLKIFSKKYRISINAICLTALREYLKNQ